MSCYNYSDSPEIVCFITISVHIQCIHILNFFASQVALEELQDLKGVWSELSKVWEQIDQMKEQPWVSVQPRKVLLQLFM